MNAKTLLILSLVVNLGLIGYFYRRPSAAEQSATPVAKPAVAAKKIGTNKKNSPGSVTNTLTRTVDWRSVESEDYKQYVANLRSIGCPEETIRDIIIADVNKLYESRQSALVAGTRKFEYWRTGQSIMPTLDGETLKQRQALANEKRALLRELLGVDIVDTKADVTATALGPMLAMLDFLPGAKQDQVIDLMLKYQSLAVKSLKGGTPDADDIKGLQKIKSDMQADLARMLTPEEYQSYQLRLSETAVVMRMQLGSFEPNEQEFSSIFKLKKEFDDQYPGMLVSTLEPEEKAKRDAAAAQLEGKMQALLGPERYADYQRSMDGAYSGMLNLVEKQGLPKETAAKAYEVKRVAEDQARMVRYDQSIPEAQRLQALQTIQQETEAQVRRLFGDAAFEAYRKQQGNVRWLRNLTEGK